MKTLVSAAAVAAIAGSAFGLGETLDRSSYPIYSIDTPGVTITKTPLHATDRGSLGSGAAQTSVYGWDDTTPTSGIAGSGFLASPAATGIIGIEDYGSTLSSSGAPNGSPTTQFDTMGALAYEFVGGVAQTGGILFFDFYFNDFSYGNGFGVQFPSAGNFIWTITLSPTVVVPTEGFHVMTTNTNPNIGPITTGQWFVSDSGANPQIGHNDNAYSLAGTYDYGSGSVDLGYLFALGVTVPTPGAIGLMGVAGLAGISRRRR